MLIDPPPRSAVVIERLWHRDHAADNPALFGIHEVNALHQVRQVLPVIVVQVHPPSNSCNVASAHRHDGDEQREDRDEIGDC